MKPARRDLTEREKEILKQKQKEFLDELLEEEVEILALFIDRYEKYKNKEGEGK
ncbi:MAG TPA: hypothetical protein GX516_05240 [Thermoanaerobacter sp.]|nr:hypothetical protein [Thermoanaerobacter sp.]